MRWTANAVCIRMRNALKILAEKHKNKRRLRWYRHRYKTILKQILRETDYKIVHWIKVAQHKSSGGFLSKWQRTFWSHGNFLASWTGISFLCGDILHGIIYWTCNECKSLSNWGSTNFPVRTLRLEISYFVS